MHTQHPGGFPPAGTIKGCRTQEVWLQSLQQGRKWAKRERKMWAWSTVFSDWSGYLVTAHRHGRFYWNVCCKPAFLAVQVRSKLKDECILPPSVFLSDIANGDAFLDHLVDCLVGFYAREELHKLVWTLPVSTRWCDFDQPPLIWWGWHFLGTGVSSCLLWYIVTRFRTQG